jgi:hypothetical protein
MALTEEQKRKIEIKYIVAIIISAIIGASILGYGYLDYRYKKETLEQKMKADEQARLDREAEQVLLQGCLDEIKERFGNAVEDKNNVPYEEAKMMLGLYQKERDECFRKYPLK